MEIKRISHSERNFSSHHKTMSEQDANRLLEEITMNPNAIEKKYIDIGKLYNKGVDGKRTIVVNNELSTVEELEILDSSFYKNKIKEEKFKGLFFTLNDKFYSDNKEFQKVIQHNIENGYISPNAGSSKIYERFGILAVGEYNEKGEMLGTKLTLGFKNDVNVVEPFSEIFTTGAGRTTGQKIIVNGTIKSATKTYSQTMKGKVITDASAQEAASVITNGLRGLVMSKKVNLIDSYLENQNLQKHFFQYSLHAFFEKYNDFNTEFSKNVVRMFSDMLDSNFENEKFISSKKVISKKYYEDVFGKTLNKEFNVFKNLSNFQEQTHEAQVNKIISNLFSETTLKSNEGLIFTENDSIVHKFLKQTNLIEEISEGTYDTGFKSTYKFVDKNSKIIAEQFEEHVKTTTKERLMKANKNIEFNRENFAKIQNNLKNEMSGISIQNEFVDYIHSKTSDVEINISTLKEISKNGSDVKVKKISKTIGDQKKIEPDFSFSVISDEGKFKMEGLNVFEKQYVRTMMFDNDIVSSDNILMSFKVNNEKLELNIPFAAHNKKTDEYYVKQIKIKSNKSDIQEFKAAYESKSFEINSLMSENEVMTINRTNAANRVLELNSSKEIIDKKLAEELMDFTTNIKKQTVSLNSYLAIFNKEDISKFNIYNNQTSVMGGKATVGTGYSGDNVPGSTGGDFRQPLAQNQNVMFEQEIHGTVVTEHLVENMKQPDNLEDRTLVKGRPFITEQQRAVELETSKSTNAVKRRNDVNGYVFYTNDDTTFQENAPITKQLKMVGKFSEEQTLTLRFNQINDNFYNLEEVKKMGINKHNIAKEFGRDEEKAKKIINLLMVDKFVEKTKKQELFLNKGAEELNAAVKEYTVFPERFLMQKEKSGKATLLKKEFVSNSATTGVKVDFGLALKGYEYDNNVIKFTLDKIKVADEGSKISVNGSKVTISTIYDTIKAKSNGKTFSALLSYNAKSENRKQAGLELYNIYRTSVYNLSETSPEKLKGFLNDPLIKKFSATFGMEVTENNTINEIVYKLTKQQNYTEYDKYAKTLFDYHNGVDKSTPGFKKGLESMAKIITGKSNHKLDVAEIGASILGKYEEYGGKNITPILIKNAIIEYEKNGVITETPSQNIYRFLATIHRNRVTETKAFENAVNFNEDSLRLLKEKGQHLLARTIEDMIEEQAVRKEGLGMEHFWLLNSNQIDQDHKEDFIKHIIDKNNNEIVEYDLSKASKEELQVFTNKEYIKSDNFFETKIGKIIEEKNLSDGEFLDKNVVSILKSDNVNKFAKQMEEIQLSPEQKEITYQSFRKEINAVLTSSKSEREKKDYVIKIIRAQLEPATKNEYEETIKMFMHNNSYETKNIYSNIYLNQINDLKNGKLIGVSNLSELAIDKEGKIVLNEELNKIKRWARAEESVSMFDIEKIIKNVENMNFESSDFSFTMLQKEIHKPKKAITSLMNLIDKTTFEKFKNSKGSMYKNISTVRIKNSFMAAPANNDLIFEAWAKTIENPNFEKHLKDFFGEDIANKLNKFERIKHGGSITIEQSIVLTKQNFIKNLKELNDIAIVKDSILPEHFNLLNSFEKTESGIMRTFGKYVGYPLQTVANLSSSLLIAVNHHSENIFAKVMMKNGILENEKNKQIFFLNKKTWFKALRDFDGDKAQYMFNVLNDYEKNKNLYDNFILRDKYETFIKNGIHIEDDMLKKLNITKAEHRVEMFNHQFREYWYDAKLKKEIGKHDLQTANVIEYYLNKSVNENISVSESITRTMENFNSKYDWKTEKFISSLTDEEKHIFESMLKSKRFKLDRETALHSTENIKNMMKTLTGIKDTGKIHSGVTQFRRLAGNIAYNELDEKMFIENPQAIERIREIQNNIRSNMTAFSETAGMLIEDGAISAKHGQNAIVPSLIGTFEDIIKTKITDELRIESQAKQTSVLRKMTEAKTIQEYDNLHKHLNTRNKNVMSEISEFINSSMGSGFDSAKYEYEHKMIVSKIYSQINETGNFLNEIRQHKGKNFFSGSKEDILYKMDIANNLFSKTSKINNDSEMFEIIDSISSNRESIFKPRYLGNFFSGVKTSFGEKVDNFKNDSFLKQLEKEDYIPIEKLSDDKFAENFKRLIKHTANDTINTNNIINEKEVIKMLDLSKHNPEAGKTALTNFLNLLKSEGTIMEGSYISSHERTLNITERTFVALKKMIR